MVDPYIVFKMIENKKASWRIIHTVVTIIIAILIAIVIISLLIVSWGGLASSESKAKASLVHMQASYDKLHKISIPSGVPVNCDVLKVYLSKGYQMAAEGKEVSVYNITENGTRDTTLRKIKLDKPICCPKSKDKELKCCLMLEEKNGETKCKEGRYCDEDLLIGGYRRITGDFCLCDPVGGNRYELFPKGWGTCHRWFT